MFFFSCEILIQFLFKKISNKTKFLNKNVLLVINIMDGFEFILFEGIYVIVVQLHVNILYINLKSEAGECREDIKCLKVLE